jgi:hypothetical protein
MPSQRRSSSDQLTFLVEGYWPDSGTDAFRAAASRLDERFEALGAEGVVMRTVAATLVPKDRAAYWLIAGPSAAVVAKACDAAGLVVERVVDAVELRADGTRSVTRAGRRSRCGR